MPNYYNSHNNFGEAKGYFNDTKFYTDYEKYLTILDLYVRLTDSGARLTMLRYNASLYLMYLIENLTFDAETNKVTYLLNVTGLLFLFDQTLEAYGSELQEYEECKDEIDEYEFFEEER